MMNENEEVVDKLAKKIAIKTWLAGIKKAGFNFMWDEMYSEDKIEVIDAMVEIIKENLNNLKQESELK